jgi:hypothetical protein
MPSRRGHRTHDEGAKLARELRKLPAIEPAKFGRIVDRL